MKKEAKETPDWKIILAICISVVALVILVILVTFWVKKSIENYNDCAKLVPTEHWFEEELEKTFLTTDLYVVDIDDFEYGSVVVTIKIWVNSQVQYYRCLYKLKSFDSFNWHWELVKYV
nr:MAG TPA: hypothetical protein [Caudoviricetes sp.]